MVNMKPTGEYLKSQHINLSSFCRENDLPYPVVHQMLRKTRILETRQQMQVIEVLKSKGFFVEASQP